MSAHSKTKSQQRGLKPFVPGDPRINRKGRPRKDAAQDDARDLLEMTTEQLAGLCETFAKSFRSHKKNPLDVKKIIIIGKIATAINDAESKTGEELFCRAYGKPSQSITDEDGGSILESIATLFREKVGARRG